jgi:hypothetical protein
MQYPAVILANVREGRYCGAKTFRADIEQPLQVTDFSKPIPSRPCIDLLILLAGVNCTVENTCKADDSLKRQSFGFSACGQCIVGASLPGG